MRRSPEVSPPACLQQDDLLATLRANAVTPGKTPKVGSDELKKSLSAGFLYVLHAML